MKRFTHFTNGSNVAYWELDIEDPRGVVAIKPDGTRHDLREHWNPKWTLDALADGRWIEMEGEETPDQARMRAKQGEFLEDWSPEEIH